jgi:L-lactate dehydrogenase complex protein LldF
VYRKIGGHNYPWIYSGPIGAVITPQFHGVQRDPWLPYASSLCGACGEVCPVKIDIPKLLLDLRADVVASSTSNGIEKTVFRMWAAVMTRPALYRAALAAGSVTGSAEKRWIGNSSGMLSVGPIKAWLGERDLPTPAPKTFRQLWRERH